MSRRRLTPEQVETLSALARGIIPRDDRDDDCAEFSEERLAEKIEAQVDPAPYFDGLEFAANTAASVFGCLPAKLDSASLEKLLGLVRDARPAFFKFIRAETCALYLSDPAVWKRIGFPGPSIQTGGYPDFDQPQDE